MVKSLKEKILERRIARLEKLVTSNKQCKFEDVTDDYDMFFFVENITYDKVKVSTFGGGEGKASLRFTNVKMKCVGVDSDYNDVRCNTVLHCPKMTVLVEINGIRDLENIENRDWFSFGNKDTFVMKSISGWGKNYVIGRMLQGHRSNMSRNFEALIDEDNNEYVISKVIMYDVNEQIEDILDPEHEL